MTKKELSEYKNLLIETVKLSKRIARKERQLEEVHIICDRVQSTMKEFPYIRTYEKVEAPEPRRYTAIKNDLAELEKRKEMVEEKLLILDKFINSIDDSRSRQIIEYRYVEGNKLIDVARHYNLTEQAVLKIINKSIDEFNTV